MCFTEGGEARASIFVVLLFEVSLGFYLWIIYVIYFRKGKSERR
jgi:hypothetical protein